MHDRRFPKRNRFRYGIFTFALDLDELEELDSKLRCFGFEKRALFRFSKADHLDFGKRNVKENILEYLQSNGITDQIAKVILITNLRVMGYVFNPVSFYFFTDRRIFPFVRLRKWGIRSENKNRSCSERKLGRTELFG